MPVPPILRLLRPAQWVKNAFVLLPLFFGQQMTNVHLLVRALVAALVFSLAASAVYCLNDILDREADAQHPTKCRRPIASGAVSVTAGWTLCAACVVVAAALTWWLLPPAMLWLMAAYLVLNVAYSSWLKHISLVDVLIVAAFYVMRVEAGSLTTGIALSHWLVVMTFLLALLLVLGKRRDDVVLQAESGKVVRRGVASYNIEFINMALTMVATITMVAYMMYTMSDEVITRLGNRHIYCTSVFALAGILRYLQITLVENKSGSPTRVLAHDRFIQVCLACWVLAFVVIIYC